MIKKKTTNILILLILFSSTTILSSCSKSDTSEEKRLDGNFIYQKDFLLESIPETFNSKSVSQLSEMKNIPDSLLNSWVKPFREAGQQGNKAISYQFKGKDYHAIIIGVIDDFYIDEQENDNSYSTLTQYLLTVKNDGSFIDGLKVYENLSKADLDDEYLEGKLIMTKTKWSRFNQDTTHMYDKTYYVKETVLSETGSLEKVLSEEFEGTDKTTFVINPNGKFKKLDESKGEIKKTSENTSEKIKIN